MRWTKHHRNIKELEFKIKQQEYETQLLRIRELELRQQTREVQAAEGSQFDPSRYMKQFLYYSQAAQLHWQSCKFEDTVEL